MPVRTFLIAAGSAATGALATTIFLKSLQKQPPPSPSAPPSPSSAPPSSPSIASIPAPIPSPPQPRFSISATPKTPVNPSDILLYGSPGPIADAIPRLAYLSSFDRRTRNPHWVAEHITRESLLIKSGDRGTSQFLEDPLLPSKFRALLKDYVKSGYDRGHQAPAANAKWSQAAMDETFYLTNMCPQVGQGFNRDYWAHFEDFCRRLTSKYPSVRIITGPLYLPKRDQDGKWRVSYEVIGSPPNISVPTHFFKIIIAEQDSEAMKDPARRDPIAVGAFVLPNATISNSTDLKEFEVPVEMVERASGLTFLEKLPEKRKKQLCQEIECSITVREFDNARKEAGGKKRGN